MAKRGHRGSAHKRDLRGNAVVLLRSRYMIVVRISSIVFPLYAALLGHTATCSSNVPSNVCLQNAQTGKAVEVVVVAVSCAIASTTSIKRGGAVRLYTKMASVRDNCVQRTVPVLTRHIGFLVGREGRVLQNIKHAARCDVRVDRPRGELTDVRVAGRQDKDVYTAQQLIVLQLGLLTPPVRCSRQS